ncbi:MAG: hypothetical protein JO047_10595 [Alphaproteobacteria bacterium]|nr:hypothetical protein [Alphaproteobacteria bacterium]
MANLLADTGVWYALYIKTDQHHAKAREQAELFELHHVILPWPVFYEVLRTKMVRNARALRLFEDHLRSMDWTELDDRPYRQAALHLCFDSALAGSRPMSLIDCTIRLILNDRNVAVDLFMTFNARDFHDVCGDRQIQMV